LDEDVRYSAEIALADLAFLKHLRSRTQKTWPLGLDIHTSCSGRRTRVQNTPA